MPLDKIRLSHFKGFEEFTLRFRPGLSVLVGPNNAGKSTTISALRLCAVLLASAKNRKLDTPLHDESRGRRVRGGHLSLPATQFVDENIRHEFREIEARLELTFKNKAVLYVVWPVNELPFYYLEHVPGMQPRGVKQVKECYSTFGVLAPLAPVEHQESVLSPNHIKDNYSSRLVSRHFRNQLNLVRLEDPVAFDELISFIEDNTPELSNLALVQSDGYDRPRQLDLFFQEVSGSTERELYWAGDGIQIWVQILFHLWRLRSSATILLDEPDVFLHPDLQRRLVRILEDEASQIVLATHAPEVLTEASRDAVIIVDRTRRNSRRVSDEKVLAQLNDVLGSGFNLRLAKALRSRVALFVEGKDMKVLKNVAKAVGAQGFYQEIGLSVTAMQGAANRDVAGSFGWLNENLLDNAVEVRMLLDRDYMSDEACHDIVSNFAQMGVGAHVWGRKELESYLLIPSLIARVSGCPLDEVHKHLEVATQELKAMMFSRLLDEQKRVMKAAKPGLHEVTISQEFYEAFEQKWLDSDWRLHRAPAKEVITRLNSALQQEGYRPVSSRALSARIAAHEVPAEMRDLILEVEAALASPSVAS